jgi:hypothetical protein
VTPIHGRGPAQKNEEEKTKYKKKFDDKIKT